MHEDTTASKATVSASEAVAPPPVSHTAAIVATALLLTVWAILTFAAAPLTPLIQDVALRIELGLGLDVMPGPRPDDDAKKKEEGESP